jgi:hypothetical protein
MTENDSMEFLRGVKWDVIYSKERANDKSIITIEASLVDRTLFFDEFPDGVSIFV